MTISLTETGNTEATVSKYFTSYVNGIVEGTDMHIMLEATRGHYFIHQ